MTELSDVFTHYMKRYPLLKARVPGERLGTWILLDPRIKHRGPARSRLAVSPVPLPLLVLARPPPHTLFVEFCTNAIDNRVEVLLRNDVEEANLVYDLVQSGRLLVENKDVLPLPFRGQFLFKLPQDLRPVDLQIARIDTGAEERLKGGPELMLYVAPPKGKEGILGLLMEAMRDVPPASAEEFERDTLDEYAKVRNLTHAQRIIYATRAGQGARSALMQQPNPLLLLYLLKNPLITLPEVIQIAKLPSIDALVADYIARLVRSNPQWGINEELRFSLATNAKTPGGTALSLLKTLNSRNLRQICKQGDVRGTLKQAAMRILTERRD